MIRWFLLISVVISSAWSARILFVNTWQSKSHARTMLPLAERLHDRGHNVSMYSQVTTSLGKLGKKITSIESILPKEYRTGDTGVVDKLFWNAEMDPSQFEEPHKIGYQYMNFSKNDENFLRLLDTCYDFVIVDEMFCVAQTAIALHLHKKCGSKIGIFATTDLFLTFSRFRGLARNPVTYANYYTKGYSMFNFNPADFGTRLVTVKDALVEPIYSNYLSNNWIRKAGELLNMQVSQEQIYQKSIISFTDYPSSYGYPTTNSNDLIDVGEHCQDPHELPFEYQQILEDPHSKGTIYIAFGSITNWAAGPPKVVDVFANVLNKFEDYRIIWSYTGAKIEHLKPHVTVTRWAPQNEILSHPRTILFFTHGGLKSLREGICSETPMLFMPFFADQPKNALYAMSMNIAEAIYKKNITETEMENKMHRALESTVMKKNIKKLKSVYMDNIINSLDLGAFWVEKMLRTSDKAGKFRDIHGKNIGWLEFAYLQPILIVGFILFVVSQ